MFDHMQREALERLIGHAKGTGDPASKVAIFLKCWWNDGIPRKLNFPEHLVFDYEIFADVMAVFQGFCQNPGLYINDMGYEDDFAEIFRLHR